MDYSSILFSREHLARPFTLNQNNNSISIADKKAQTIALSIIVGLLTAGIGGIVFFYCLTAKYKVDLLTSSRISSYAEKKISKIEIHPEQKISNGFGEFIVYKKLKSLKSVDS